MRLRHGGPLSTAYCFLPELYLNEGFTYRDENFSHFFHTEFLKNIYPFFTFFFIKNTNFAGRNFI